MKAVLFIIPILLLGSCATTAPSHVNCLDWNDLFKNPESYTGKKIALYGYFRAEFEACSLTEIGGGHELWVEPSINSGDLCSIKQTSLNPINQEKAVAIGYFNYGGAYGHFGIYKAALGDTKLLLDSDICTNH
jgi:hypothetical protein